MTAADLAGRSVPRWGGLNPTLVRIELRRMVRNRRTVVFTFVMPVVFFLLFGTNDAYAGESAGDHGNVAAYIMVSMALYGAMIATTSGGAMVSVERAAGWSRQLRLTPLTAGAYVGVKIGIAMLLGLAAALAVNVAALFTRADMPAGLWLACLLLAWLLSGVFAAFGLFMGYLLPSENVMQVLGPALAVLAFGGGLFVPIEDGTLWASIATWTPMYGVSDLAHLPLTGGELHATSVVNVLAWAALFVVGAAWRYRRDTARG